MSREINNISEITEIGLRDRIAWEASSRELLPKVDWGQGRNKGDKGDAKFRKSLRKKNNIPMA